MDEETNPPDLTQQQDDSLEDAFKKVEADMLAQLGKFIDEAIMPVLPKSTLEQRAELVAVVNTFMTDDSETEETHDFLNQGVENKARDLVTHELGVGGGDEFDALCDKVCAALDEAVDETAIYGQMKGHEMMGEIFGIESTGPVRVENGEVLTTVAMGGATRNADGSWSEFGDDLSKVG